LGMNYWMSDPFPYPEKDFDRGKVLTDKDTKKLENFARYKDVDGDGITYRTYPGIKNPNGVYFNRGSGHDENANYSEQGHDYQQLMDRLDRKWETAKSFVPKPVLIGSGKAKLGVIAYGSTDEAARESMHQLNHEFSMEIDYLRIRAYPFTKEVEDFLESHEKIYVIEQNRDAQMLSLLKIEKGYEKYATKMESILNYDGFPISPSFINETILTAEGEQKKSA